MAVRTVYVATRLLGAASPAAAFPAEVSQGVKLPNRCQSILWAAC